MNIFAKGLFADRVAVVTGGATGLGLEIAEQLVQLGALAEGDSLSRDSTLEIAEQLVQLGARVVIASRKPARLTTAARGLMSDYPGSEVVPQPCNIRERAEVEALFDAVLARFGRVDFVVNNGGGQFPSPAESITEKGWRAVLDTNLTGTFHVCQVAAQKHMLEHGGKIVSIVADMWRGFPGMAHTGAARTGVVNLTQTLAIEWAARGIKLNCVAPGVILTTGRRPYDSLRRQRGRAAAHRRPPALLGGSPGLGSDRRARAGRDDRHARRRSDRRGDRYADEHRASPRHRGLRRAPLPRLRARDPEPQPEAVCGRPGGVDSGCEGGTQGWR